jgi:hypothetical protein
MSRPCRPYANTLALGGLFITSPLAFDECNTVVAEAHMIGPQRSELISLGTIADEDDGLATMASLILHN